MSYTPLPSLMRGILLVILTVTLIFYLYCLLRIILLGRKKRELVFPGIMTFLTFLLFEIMTMIQQKDQPPIPGVPVPLLLISIVVLMSYVVCLQVYIRRWQKTHVSAMSYREAFNCLPTGLLFYSRTGVPIMVNEAMQEISRGLFGKPVTDGGSFWEEVRGGEDKDTDRCIRKTETGKVYSIRKDEILESSIPLYQVTAVDISREYEMTGNLKERQEKARLLNSRLKVLMDSIEYVTMNRELLQLKTALHENIGQCILIAKRYLYAPESVDRKRMLDFWKECMRHLINEKPEVWELPYYVTSREADQLGIHLEIIGQLPDEPAMIPVIDTAISTHIGNTLKHANGTEAIIAATEKNGKYILTFTNNGMPPEGRITEKGGLLNLRREVERIGGELTIRSEPVFEMKIILPGRK